MPEETVDVCVQGSLRRPARKGGAISVFFCLGLRERLRVSESATLIVHDCNGARASLGPTDYAQSPKAATVFAPTGHARK